MPDGPDPAAGTAPEPSPALRRAVRGYLDHLTVERGLSANTLSSYRRDLARYLAGLAADGIGDLAAVGPADVAAHVARLRAGAPGQPPLSAASAARAASAVRGLHRFAAREGLAGADPSREVRPPVPPRRLPRALDVTEVLRLLEAAGPAAEPSVEPAANPGPAGSAAPAGPAASAGPAAGLASTGGPSAAAGLASAAGPLELRDRALLEFLYGTGARISEAVDAVVDDLDLAAGTALLHGKGGRTRLVPVGGYACAALTAYLVRARPALAAAGRGVPAVFLNARGGALSRQSAWTILRRAAVRAGLPVSGGRAVSPHTLRHSYATHLLDGGADVRVVQELLGHASVTTTQVYTLVTVERLREVYATAHPRARG
ncbi:site-specific tyrosine recombinase XerD [Plantactinospora sp. KBS50]|nr:site-specific tyrosine recombinase XerD [Plantactinospora sp. KBS50]